MSTTITEAELITPVFTGDELSTIRALNTWTSVVSTVSGISELDEANKNTIFCALAALCQSKLSPEPINVPTPVATAMPTFAGTPEVASAEVSYAEQKKVENPMLKRMRELAGIAHPENRV